jgi:glycosyltransferase involved in cell wall biosynthesis
MKKKIKITVIGQTPPPYGGQALAIENIVNSSFDGIELYHVRMCFSKEMNERGKLSLYKITHLFDIIFKAILLRFKYNVSVLYYPPSNSPKISVYRDLIILFFVRPFYKKTIFHFHAAGISEYLESSSAVSKWIGKGILNKPTLGIVTSNKNPQDPQYLNAVRSVEIPYGINDDRPKGYIKEYKKSGNLSVFFMGLLNSTKGEGYLVDAVGILKKNGVIIDLKVAGKFETEEYRNKFFEKVEKNGIAKNFEYLGVITGKKKTEAYMQADLFCFPSFFISESFGIVLIEAMSFHLPLIATKWRGIQSVVQVAENGYLVDIKNAEQIADKLLEFNNNPNLLEEYGSKSRELFEKKYTLSSYIENIEKEFINI